MDVSRSRGELSGICAQIITDELIHELVRTEGFRVSAASSIAPLVAQALDLPSVAQKLDLQFVFEGAVHEDNNQLRITSRVVSADGFLIWSERFETEPDRPSFFKVSEHIASRLISHVSPEKSSVPKQEVEQRGAPRKAPLKLGSMRKSRGGAYTRPPSHSSESSLLAAAKRGDSASLNRLARRIDLAS